MEFMATNSTNTFSRLKLRLNQNKTLQYLASFGNAILHGYPNAIKIFKIAMTANGEPLVDLAIFQFFTLE